MKGWKRLVALACGFGFTVYMVSYFSRLPESNCTTNPVSDLWSGDRIYKATLLKKVCNLSETVFYSVRLDKPDTWFLVLEIEQDPYPAPASEPAMKWDLHRLEIQIRAENFSGSIERREGDLTVARSYVRAKDQ